LLEEPNSLASKSVHRSTSSTVLRCCRQLHVVSSRQLRCHSRLAWRACSRASSRCTSGWTMAVTAGGTAEPKERALQTVWVGGHVPGGHVAWVMLQRTPPLPRCQNNCGSELRVKGLRPPLALLLFWPVQLASQQTAGLQSEMPWEATCTPL